MLLLSLVRCLFILLGLFVTHTFQVAYHLDDLGTMLVATLVVFGCWAVSDIVENKLIQLFNREDARG